MDNAHEIYAPRIKDPDTMRLCIVQKVRKNPYGQVLLVVREDPDSDGVRRREAQRKPYTVAVKALWYSA